MIGQEVVYRPYRTELLKRISRTEFKVVQERERLPFGCVSAASCIAQYRALRAAYHARAWK